MNVSLLFSVLAAGQNNVMLSHYATCMYCLRLLYYLMREVDAFVSHNAVGQFTVSRPT